MRRIALADRKILALALLLIAWPVASPAAAGQFDPARVRWASLEFSASRFMFTARTSIAAQLVPAGTIVTQLRTTPTGRPVMPGAEVVDLVYAMSGFGRESRTELWLDPVTGGTLQRTQHDTGSRPRLRTYRFTDRGAFHFTRWPANRSEQAQTPEHWTHVEQGMRPYVPGDIDQPVTEPTALLWLIAAADLARPGDRMEVLAFSRRQVSRVDIDVTGQRTVALNFMEEGPAGARRRDGRMPALVLRLAANPLDAAAEEQDFELFGLHGDLELLLDPQTRAPLELSGRVRIAGQVTVRLNRLVLR